MNGIFNILKPPGMTSHDVVSFTRKTINQRKVGHTGTLDPGAAGVLTVCVGKATRIIQYLPSNKRYRAEVTFGISTTTQDAYGDVIKFDEDGAGKITVADIDKLLPSITGEVKQIPPMASAIKHQGKKLYELARKGIEVERKPRTVYVHNIAMIDFNKTDSSLPKAVLDIYCSAGTYIRTICHDLGELLGCGAYMSFLLRTQAGNFTINDTVALEQLVGQQEEDMLNAMLVSMKKSLEHLPQIDIKGDAVGAISCGNRLVLPAKCVGQECSDGNVVRLEGPDGLLAIAKIIYKPNASDNYVIQPVKVLV